MSREYEDYMAQAAACERATANVERQIEQLRKFTTPLLFKWNRYYVDANVAMPMDMTDRRIRVSGRDVPTPSDIATAMVAQFKAMQTMKDAWKRIPKPEREALRTPSWLAE